MKVLKKLNNFIISFFSVGITKVLGFFKTFILLNLLGTSSIGDLYKLAYNWPNLIRRILVDGALHYAIIPYLLDSKDKHSPEEFSKKAAAVNNFFNFFVILLIILFVVIFPYMKDGLITHILDKKIMDFYYRLFFFVIYPISMIGVFTVLLNAKEKFQWVNFVGIIGNIVFIGTILFLSKFIFMHPLTSIWMALMANGFIQMGLLFYNLRKQKILTIKDFFSPFKNFLLPKKVYINICKSLFIQFCSRFNFFVSNIIGTKVGIPGVLMAFEFTDRLITGAISLFAVTVSIIAMPIFHKALCHNDINGVKSSQKIIITTLLIGGIFSLFAYILSEEIILFLIGYKSNINNEIISFILRLSAWQIFLYCLLKLLNTIVIVYGKINFVVYSGIFSSLLSTFLEVSLYKKLKIYAVMLSQYSFILMEILILLYLLHKDEKIRKFLIDILPFNIIFKILCKFFIAGIILFLTKIFIYKKIIGLSYVSLYKWRLLFLCTNVIWGVIILTLFWKQFKIFIFKEKI